MPLRCSLHKLFWQLLATSAATIYHYLWVDELLFPYPLFRLDDCQQPETLAERLLATPACSLDSWSAEHLKRYSSVQDLLSPVAVSERKATLISLKLCVTRIEARHSAVRRNVKASSLQSSAVAVSSVSATFLLRSQTQRSV